MKTPKFVKVFNKGQKVYAIKNNVWGYSPMKVIEADEEGCTCQHPSLGSGRFSNTHLAGFTENREKRLKAMQKEFNTLERKEDRMFKQISANSIEATQKERKLFKGGK